MTICGNIYILDGLYVSGVYEAFLACLLEELDPQSFKVYCGHYAWSREELEFERASGLWFTAEGVNNLSTRNIVLQTDVVHSADPDQNPHGSADTVITSWDLYSQLLTDLGHAKYTPLVQKREKMAKHASDVLNWHLPKYEQKLIDFVSSSNLFDSATGTSFTPSDAFAIGVESFDEAAIGMGQLSSYGTRTHLEEGWEKATGLWNADQELVASLASGHNYLEYYFDNDDDDDCSPPF